MIHLVTALPAEARPLVRRFALERVADGAFPVWRRDDVALVVSGVGAVAAAAAIAHLAGQAPDRAEAAWLNVGVGGHRTLDLGEPVLAHKVVDHASGRSWYPPLVFEPPCATATVTTVTRPETGYPEETVYEMEAAGFCAAAAAYASAELVQVVKVISDNAGSPPDRLGAARVEELIAGRIEVIVGIAEETSALAAELAERRAPPAALAALLERWRFTVTEQRRLERLVRRLAIVEAADLDPGELASLASGPAVLAALERRLAARPPGV